MRVLILGSGGREHALAWKLNQSPEVTGLYAMPGSAGMESLAFRVLGDPSDPSEVLKSARSIGADLVVVGPEAPLAEGVVDVLDDAGIPAFGPTRDAARIESSKIFAKELMREAGIPTADFEVFDRPEAAMDHVERIPLPTVIKADGLAAGKGVTVASSREEAREAVKEAMVDRRFGSAGSRLLIEDCLVGEELSVMAVSDGETVVPLAAARDYKAVDDGDRGPNTGGMGCISPVPGCDDDMLREVRKYILQPAVDQMRRRGSPFRGLLYAGLMLTADGPMVLEFNCRFGDPETQVVLPRMESDLLPLLLSSAGVFGDLSQLEGQLFWCPDSAVCVVMASGGYPGSYQTGLPILGLDELPEEVEVFHAGTDRGSSGWVTAGGRVLGVTAMGSDLESARRSVYAAVEEISFPHAHFRRDIGAN
ncbi:MAG: phosphoribosylamine--glycine ligase [Clostridia bacterium]